MTREEAITLIDELIVCIKEHPIIANWLVEIADRKTENSSEKPNNSTISKMEQVETMSCQECKHWDVYKGCRERVCKYEPKDEPTSSKMEQVEDEPQTERSE